MTRRKRTARPEILFRSEFGVIGATLHFLDPDHCVGLDPWDRLLNETKEL
jgi:hypothetical protein